MERSTLRNVLLMLLPLPLANSLRLLLHPTTVTPESSGMDT